MDDTDITSSSLDDLSSSTMLSSPSKSGCSFVNDMTTLLAGSSEIKIFGRIDFANNGVVYLTKYIVQFGLIEDIVDQDKFFFNGQLYRLSQEDYKTFLATKEQFEAESRACAEKNSSLIASLRRELEEIEQKKKKLQQLANDPDMKQFLSVNTEDLEQKAQQKQELLEATESESFQSVLTFTPTSSPKVPQFSADVYVVNCQSTITTLPFSKLILSETEAMQAKFTLQSEFRSRLIELQSKQEEFQSKLLMTMSNMNKIVQIYNHNEQNKTDQMMSVLISGKARYIGKMSTVSIRTTYEQKVRLNVETKTVHWNVTQTGHFIDFFEGKVPEFPSLDLKQELKNWSGDSSFSIQCSEESGVTRGRGRGRGSTRRTDSTSQVFSKYTIVIENPSEFDVELFSIEAESESELLSNSSNHYSVQKFERRSNDLPCVSTDLVDFQKINQEDWFVLCLEPIQGVEKAWKIQE